MQISTVIENSSTRSTTSASFFFRSGLSPGTRPDRRRCLTDKSSTPQCVTMVARPLVMAWKDPEVPLFGQRPYRRSDEAEAGGAGARGRQATSYLYVTRPPRESSQVPFFAPTTPPPVQDLEAPEYTVHEAVWADLPARHVLPVSPNCSRA